jgi:glycosyltransferase involved in cell wall biosynthesis
MRIAVFGNATSINVRRWCEGLAAAGADIHLISIHAGPEAPADTILLSTPPVPEKLRYFAAVPAARQAVRRLRPDLVMGYYATGYGTLAALCGFRPYVIVTAGDDILISPSHPLLGRLVRFNLMRADLVTAWAPHMAQAVCRLGVPSDKVFILPRGIPLHRFEGQMADKPSQRQPFRLVSTRSLYEVYRIDAIIRALAVLRRAGREVTLTVAGDGDARPALERLTAAEHLEDAVTFTGRLHNDALPEVLSQHDAYVSVIHTDGVSASLLEAMAVGLFPMVYDHASNHGWVTHGENGLLIPDQRPESIADAVERAMDDIDLRQRAWTLNPQRIRRDADLTRNTAAYLARFQQLVGETGRQT